MVPVSYVIFRRNNQVLLQLRQGTGYLDGNWATAAAGHVEAGESAVQAAIREAREELGLSLNVADLIPLTTLHRTQESSSAGDVRVDFFFECQVWRGNPQIMEPHKVADLAWFDLADLPTAFVPHERYVMDRLRYGLPPIVALGFV